MSVNLNPSFAQVVGANEKPEARAKAPYIIGRVTHVVTGPFYAGTTIKDPYYTNPTDIGSIKYQLLQGVQDRTTQGAGNPLAKPVFATVKQLPVLGEIVLLVPGPSVEQNENRGQQTYYYFNPFNIWNASHHNAFPDLGDISEYSNEVQRTYENSTDLNQVSNLSVTQSGNYPLSPGFNESSTIKSLRTFTGDVTVEGRWGNSIRFGSTTANRAENNWSSTGSVGDPITIIRNGQGKPLDPTAWVPTVEDINRDPSSIYLTSGQKVVIDDIQNNFSLTSLQVTLERNITQAIPVQQQLASFDSISPLEQDKRINSTRDITTRASTVESSVIQTVETPSSLTTTVVGDYQEVFGSYVVSLRALNSSGTILASVSATGASLDAAYNDAATQLKNRLPGKTLVIPNVSKLTRE